MSRGAALDYILPRVRPNEIVLDVGAGDLPFAKYFLEMGCSYLAVERDVSRIQSAHLMVEKASIITDDIRFVELPQKAFNTVLAIYSLQSMIPYEPAVWVKIHEALKPGGRLIYCGRYRKESPYYEGDRGDPLISNNETTLAHLAMLTGFKVVDFQRYQYLGDEFSRTEADTANAFGATLEAV